MDEKAVKVVGNKSNDDAKMAGITPEGFTLTGRFEFSPSNIFIPTCLLGYCRGTLRKALSTKTTNAITAITTIIRKMMVNALKAPDLPDAKNWPNAPGSSAIIPTYIIKEIPFPIPLCVICSPSHINSIVPPTSVTTQDTRKKSPGSEAKPCASIPAAMPHDWKKAKITVPYRVY